MECDALVALGRATAERQTLFGHNVSGSARTPAVLCRTVGRANAPGETIRLQHVELPQVRQTYTVLGSNTPGQWGYKHGVNEHQVAVGCTVLRPTLFGAGPPLLGPDLVRLALERSRSARQAVQIITSLLRADGPARSGADNLIPGRDHAFLIADGTEAYVMETAGLHWVYQQVREVRAVTGTRVIRQDWDRISQGFADEAIEQGCWPADGSKVDFAGALGEDSRPHASALWRWGRATRLLHEHAGHLDDEVLRRLLSEHEEPSRREGDLLCRHAHGDLPRATLGSLVASLSASPGSLPAAWCAFGPPCSSVYFPVFLDGELPAAFTQVNASPDPDSFDGRVRRLEEQIRHVHERGNGVRESFARLQARLEQEAGEFLVEVTRLRERGDRAECSRQAALFMEHNVECFEEVAVEVLRPRPVATPQYNR
jgi:secernin